jgi:hypothetical protein
MRRRRLHELLDWLGVVFIVLFIAAVLLGIALMLGWDPSIGDNQAIAPRLLN